MMVMAVVNSVVTCLKRIKDYVPDLLSHLVSMADEVSFQLLLDIVNDQRLLNYLVLPPIMKDKLPRTCRSLLLIDSQGNEYPVCVQEFGDNMLKLYYARWPEFIERNVLNDPDISKLCLRILAEDMCEVICFHSNGMEIHTDDADKEFINRCLIESSPTTFDRQYLPCEFLEDLNENSERKPLLKADLYGPNQDGQVDVIYKYNKVKKKWFAAGFNGSKWTNLCMENKIFDKYTMMFTNLRNKKYTVDVFNEAGIFLGVAAEITLEKDTQKEWEDVESEEEHGLDGSIHECSLKGHVHNPSV